MAKQINFVRFEGTLGGLTFYKKDGVSLVKTKSEVSKQRILTDRNYQRTRENMREFGGAAKAGKALREAFASVTQLMGDSYLASRLTGLMKRINLNGAGPRGARSIDIASNGALLDGFPFNPKEVLSSRFFAPYDAPTLSADRDTVTLTIPDFDAGSFVKAPQGATHFRLVLASGLISNFEYEPAVAQYEPTDDALNGLGSAVYSNDLSVQGMVGSDTTLSIDLGIGSALPATVSNVVALGIVFYQDQNGTLYELASGNAMAVVYVG
ncbi:hypothetical protein [Luteirhabdus pelagi]|uniref:hypothetical protein n=1 Tax=Luteirhabdus pelagi TaxID=2792783 RepID=UPI00193A5A8B|nr:hypothetical protein [Luteirhabdus pelagi]